MKGCRSNLRIVREPLWGAHILFPACIVFWLNCMLHKNITERVSVEDQAIDPSHYSRWYYIALYLFIATKYTFYKLRVIFKYAKKNL